MTKKKKKIPISALAKEAGGILKRSRAVRNDFKVFDIVPEWVPVPKEIQVSVQKLEADYGSKSTKFHNRFVLKLHLDGTSFGYIDNKLYTFESDEGILIFPFQSHYISGVPSSGGQLRLLINFMLDPPDQAKLEKLRNCTFKFDDRIRRLVAGLLEELQNHACESRQELYLAVIHILQALPDMPLSATAVTPARNEKFEEIFDYICRNYKEYPRVKEIAEKFGCSETGLRKLFQRECGRSPGNIIKELRLREAANLLMMTTLPIKEISCRCGFTNAYIFSRAFRNYYNKSPREFRFWKEEV